MYPVEVVAWSKEVVFLKSLTIHQHGHSLITSILLILPRLVCSCKWKGSSPHSSLFLCFVDLSSLTVIRPIFLVYLRRHHFRHVHFHLWPQLKFMKSPRHWAVLGWRPSQERNELVVPLRLLRSISELSTAVDWKCPGSHPSITAPSSRDKTNTS